MFICHLHNHTRTNVLWNACVYLAAVWERYRRRKTRGIINLKSGTVSSAGVEKERRRGWVWVWSLSRLTARRKKPLLILSALTVRMPRLVFFFLPRAHIFSVHGLADNSVFIFSRALHLTGDLSARAPLSFPSLRAGCNSIPTWPLIPSKVIIR